MFEGPPEEVGEGVGEDGGEEAELPEEPAASDGEEEVKEDGGADDGAG